MSDFLAHFTRYDVLGHLLPGYFAYLVLCIAASVYEPGLAPTYPSGVADGLLLVAISYVCGHVIHSASALLVRRKWGVQTAKVDPAVKTAAKAWLKEHGFEFDDGEFLSVVDGLQVEFPDRDVFVAREGFYRGLAFVAAMSALLAMCSAIFGFTVFIGDRPTSRGEACMVALAMTAGAALFVSRYCRFVRYQMAYSVASLARRKGGMG